MSHPLCYTRRMIKTNMKNEKETHCPPLLSTQVLLNQEVKINRGQFAGKTALVRRVMADGRSLEVEVANTSGEIAFVDVTFVSEIQERTQFAKGEPDLGPIANSVVQAGR
jgi:transcription antitermination factor NusG